MNGPQLYVLASSSYGAWLNCRCGPFCHTTSRSRNFWQRRGMNANCHHKACQRASVISSTAKMLLRLVTAFKYQQRRDYKTELIARMATGFIIIQPESRRKWILSDDTENLIQLLTRKQVQCFLGFLRLALAVVLLWLVLLSPLR